MWIIIYVCLVMLLTGVAGIGIAIKNRDFIATAFLCLTTPVWMVVVAALIVEMIKE